MSREKSGITDKETDLTTPTYDKTERLFPRWKCSRTEPDYAMGSEGLGQKKFTLMQKRWSGRRTFSYYQPFLPEHPFSIRTYNFPAWNET